MDEESVGENIMNIYLVRIEWTETNNCIKSCVYLTQQKTMEHATKWAIAEFNKGYPSIRDYRITWAENLRSELLDRYAVLIYTHGSFGLHDPFCSSNRRK